MNERAIFLEAVAKDFPNCIRCHGRRVVPGGTEEFFRVDSSIARPRAWFVGVHHDVQLDGVAWLCLDCGLVWQEVDKQSFETFEQTLREKCEPAFAQRLFP